MKPISRELMQQWLAKIDQLPQARQIPMERRKRWIESTYQIDAERMEWHIERLKGFGGSEIGALALGMQGRPGKMTQARYIVMSKLMMLSPEEPTHAMTMGLLGEPLVKNLFLKEFEVNDRPDLVRAFQGKVHSELPWMRVTPDDVISAPGSERKLLVDYKLPTEAVMDNYRQTDEVDFEHAYQLTQGMMMGFDIGVKVESALLVNMDTKLKDQGYVNVRELPFMASIAKNIVDAGNHYYQMVLNGDVPELLSTKTIALKSDDKLQGLLTNFTAAAIIHKEAEAVVEDIKQQIEAVVGNKWLEGKVVNQLADFGVRKNVNDMAVIREAKRLDIDIEEYAVMTKTYDIKALISDLESRPEADLNNLYSMSHLLSLPRGKNGTRIEMLNHFKAVGAQEVNSLYESLNQKIVDKVTKANHISDTHVKQASISTVQTKEDIANPSSPNKLTVGTANLL